MAGALILNSATRRGRECKRRWEDGEEKGRWASIMIRHGRAMVGLALSPVAL